CRSPFHLGSHCQVSRIFAVGQIRRGQPMGLDPKSPAHAGDKAATRRPAWFAGGAKFYRSSRTCGAIFAEWLERAKERRTDCAIPRTTAAPRLKLHPTFCRWLIRFLASVETHFGYYIHGSFSTANSGLVVSGGPHFHWFRRLRIDCKIHAPGNGPDLERRKQVSEVARSRIGRCRHPGRRWCSST